MQKWKRKYSRGMRDEKIENEIRGKANTWKIKRRYEMEEI